MQFPVASDGVPLLAVLAGLAVAAGYVAVAYWLHRDASARGSARPGAWVVNWVLFSVVGVGYYLLVRDRIGERTTPVTSHEQSARAVGLGVVLSLLASGALAPPDPLAQIRIFVPSLLVSLPLCYGLLVGYTHVRARRPTAD